ncbi:DUF2138 domain-containing protein [Serratia microhaemolytica]|uniref:DUF2138 domain-containing protein n=1 Tax=Serratia microhaemolytica TaxID=2675110 RepID=UPI0013921FC5|nr:DUF2138 domain-containing protein [Serratia microhaemolytica]
MSADSSNASSTSPKRRKGRYSLLALAIIFLAVAAVWGYQYLLQPNIPVTPPAALLRHNDLRIDLQHPDVLIESDSLSRLPKDLLTIPFLRETLTEDLVFYYQNNADRLGITGSLRRIIFEHELTLRDNLLEIFLNQPADIALWRDRRGRLSHFVGIIKLRGLSRLLEPFAKVAANKLDLQLELIDPRFSALTIDNQPVAVYALSYAYNKQVLFASYADRLLVFSDFSMLNNAKKPSKDSQQLFQALLSGNTPWQQSFELTPRHHTASASAEQPPAAKSESAHRISLSSHYLGFGYQRFIPALAALRFEMQPEGWHSYLALSGSADSTDKKDPFDLAPIWQAMPTGASFCLALPVSQNLPAYLLQRLYAKQAETVPMLQPRDAVLPINGRSGICWYPDSRLHSPLLVTQLSSTDHRRNDQQLATLFEQMIGSYEYGKVPVTHSKHKDMPIWQREVSSRYGQYHRNDATSAQSLIEQRFLRVTLARHHQMLLFSLDDRLVQKALKTLDQNFPPLADLLPDKTTGIVPLYVAPQALSQLLEQEVFSSLPEELEPIFYNAAQTLLRPKLNALAEQPAYSLLLPADSQPQTHWQWLPLKWQQL